MTRVLMGMVVFVAALWGQTIEDGIMMGRGRLCGGYMFTQDTWDQYWEGGLKRSNGNIGMMVTRGQHIFANYGVTDKVNVIAQLPHMRTHATQGFNAGMRGWQDATVAAKWKFFQAPLTEQGTLRLFGGISAVTPMSDYTPDFLPFSIGLGSRRLSARMTAHFRTNGGWFVNAHNAYTRRDGVELDRPFFFTNGRLTFSDRVAMPSVYDLNLSGGYIKGEMVLSGSFHEQRTLGGGDIRRNDMPFISNRMNLSRFGGWAKIPVPRHERISMVAGYSYVVNGRNVGQSTMVTAGVMYLFDFPWSRNK
jgi:hypothetical protein